MLKNEYFTKEEIIDALQEAENYSAVSFDELFNYMFNSDYYIVGTYESAEALGAFKNDENLDGYETRLDGVFGAIELVRQYELDQFGELDTPLDDPEKIATEVEYIRGEQLFSEALSKAEIDIDSKTTKKNIKKFIEAAKKL